MESAIRDSERIATGFFADANWSGATDCTDWMPFAFILSVLADRTGTFVFPDIHSILSNDTQSFGRIAACIVCRKGRFAALRGGRPPSAAATTLGRVPSYPRETSPGWPFCDLRIVHPRHPDPLPARRLGGLGGVAPPRLDVGRRHRAFWSGTVRAPAGTFPPACSGTHGTPARIAITALAAVAVLAVPEIAPSPWGRHAGPRGWASAPEASLFISALLGSFIPAVTRVSARPGDRRAVSRGHGAHRRGDSPDAHAPENAGHVRRAAARLSDASARGAIGAWVEAETVRTQR